METGKRVDMFPLQESSGFALDLTQYVRVHPQAATRVAVICNPNNPDGGYLPADAHPFMDALADLDLVVIDESFLEFADAEVEPVVVRGDDPPQRGRAAQPRQELRPARHPVRLPRRQPGAGRQDRSMLPKWNLNSFAETVVFMLKEHGRSTRRACAGAPRPARHGEPAGALPGLTVFPSQGNFLFVMQQTPQQMQQILQMQQAPQIPQQQQLYSANALPAPQGVASDAYGQSDPYGQQSVSYGQSTSQPPPELAPAYVATPPVQTPLYQAPAQQQIPQQPMQQMQQAPQMAQQMAQQQMQQAAMQQPQMGQMQQAPAPQPQAAPGQPSYMQMAQNLQAQAPQVPQAAQVPQAQSAQMQMAQADSGQIPVVQPQAPAQGAMAAYAQGPSLPEQTSLDQIPLYRPEQNAVPEPTPAEQTQVIDYDPAELRASAPARPARPADADKDPDGSGPALMRYPRPAAYLQTDAGAS
jgi:hypothetical protein